MGVRGRGDVSVEARVAAEAFRNCGRGRCAAESVWSSASSSKSSGSCGGGGLGEDGTAASGGAFGGAFGRSPSVGPGGGSFGRWNHSSTALRYTRRVTAGGGVSTAGVEVAGI